MPGVDILAQLGAAAWTTTDGPKLQHALQRARYDLLGVASRRALAGELAAGNAEVKAVLDASPQMRGWAVVNPVYPERSSEEMRKYLGSAKWLGALLHPEHSRQPLTSQPSREVLNAYRRFTKPMLVYVPDGRTVQDLDTVAGEYPNIKFIALGAGGEEWQDAILAAKRRTNIFLEPCSGGPHRGKLEAIVATLGAHRALFASNYPDQNPGSALGLLMDAKISDGEKQAILTNNAVRMFSLRAEE